MPPQTKRPILYLSTRSAWRAWLRKNHKTSPEIWLVFYKKHSGKPRIAYNDAVDEALCFGWIDSTLMAIDTDCFGQRFSPRRSKSKLSEMNKERIRRLIKQKKMTQAGLAAVQHAFTVESEKKKFVVPDDILAALKRDPVVFSNFKKYPLSYKRIRVGWIEAARHKPEKFQQRLNYFLKMTAQNKRFGMVQ